MRKHNLSQHQSIKQFPLIQTNELIKLTSVWINEFDLRKLVWWLLAWLINIILLLYLPKVINLLKRHSNSSLDWIQFQECFGAVNWNWFNKNKTGMELSASFKLGRKLIYAANFNLNSFLVINQLKLNSNPLLN